MPTLLETDNTSYGLPARVLGDNEVQAAFRVQPQLGVVEISALGKANEEVTSPAARAVQVARLLGDSEVWAAFRAQRHDLFLPAGGLTGAGVAGLLQVRISASST